MLPLGTQSVRSTVVGEQPIEEALSAGNGDSDPAHEVEIISPATINEEFISGCQTDCVVIDSSTVDGESVGIIECCAAHRPDLPVVLLLDGTDEQLSIDALSMGVAEALPRSVVDTDPDLLGKRIVSAVKREHALSSFPDLYDGVAGIVTLHDPESGAMLHANQTLCNVLGYSREGLLSMQIGEFTADVPGYDHERARDVVSSVSSQDEPLELEWPFETADGTVRWVESQLDTATFGSREFVLWSSTDITDRRRLERSRREVFENVSDGLLVHDPETSEIRDVNERYCTLTGYSREELLGEDIRLVIPDDPDYNYEDAKARIDRARAEGPQLFEFKGQRKDGTTFLGEVNLNVVDHHGEEVVLASVRDITERREYERQLHRERDRRSMLFENNLDPVVEVIFEDGRPTITAVNDSFEGVFGLDVDSINGRTVADALVPESERESYEQLLERTSRGESVKTEVCRRTEFGIREFIFRAIPFDIGDGEQRAHIWYTDITERKRREREYEQIFNMAGDGIVLHDPETGDVVNANRQIAELLDYDRQDFLDQPMSNFFALNEGVSEQRAREVVRESVRKGGQEFEWPLKTADGKTVWTWARHEIGEIGGEQRVVAVLQDITERKRREREYEQIFNSVTDAITVHDPETGEILDCNETMCELTGYDREVMLDGGMEAINVPEEGYSSERARAIIRDVMEDDERGTHEWLIERKEGERRWLEVNNTPATINGERRYLAIIRDVTEQRRTERRLRAIVERIDQAIYLSRADEITNPTLHSHDLSAGYEKIWGQPLEQIFANNEDGFFGTLHPEEREAFEAFIKRIGTDIDAGTAADRYDREYRIERPNGEVRWIQSDFYLTEWETGPLRIVIVSRDVTDRKEHERRIASFDEATDDLATADTSETATRTAVESAKETLGLPAVGAFLYDEDDGVLHPEVLTGPLSKDIAPDAIGPGDGPLWEAFATSSIIASDGETREKDIGSDSTKGPTELSGLEEWRGLALGNHGLLVVGSPDSSLEGDTVQAAHVLAATLEAALNHLRGQQRLAAQEEQLRTQTERAERLDRIARLTQQVESVITEGAAPDRIEQAVCERLVSSGPYELAWIGDVDVGTDRLAARAIVGASTSYVDGMELTTTDNVADAHPAIRAWRTGTAQVAGSIVSDGPTTDWRRRVLTEGYQSVCAVPLTYDGITHGVLAVGADSPNAFGERERDVLEQLGSSIGYALAAIERRRALESDETVELEFTGGGVNLAFARAANEAGCRVRHERTVAREASAVSVYYSFEGDVPDDVARIANRTLPGDLDVVSHESSMTLVETRPDDWFGSPLAEYGGILRDASATPDETTITVEVSAQADVRSFVERLQDIAPTLDLVAKRQHRGQDQTPAELGNRIEDELTDRQLEVLQTALSAGYFEWPREHDGSEIADRLGITQPTVNKHLRLAEQTTFELLFNADA